MVDGHCQIYNHGSSAYFYIWRRTRGMDNIRVRVVSRNNNTLGGSLARQGQKERRIKMGALIMFGLVSVIAIVGVIYFNHKDKNEMYKSA